MDGILIHQNSSSKEWIDPNMVSPQLPLPITTSKLGQKHQCFQGIVSNLDTPVLPTLSATSWPIQWSNMSAVWCFIWRTVGKNNGWLPGNLADKNVGYYLSMLILYIRCVLREGMYYTITPFLFTCSSSRPPEMVPPANMSYGTQSLNWRQKNPKKSNQLLGNGVLKHLTTQ